ncbi:beta-galactosidase [Capsulimonas corticalis]|uniref:Beta-galactosidase n=1 Tax=Capsulimonas corticalis TaxID=2219043 RepID=A0A402CV22_9BACT|nr:beta-galactosidase [Capsulimonas corticalis]BDI30252.1 beta-galactosidase [Capsulimonas corticalis]
MEKALRVSHLTLGVCYYPEHWDESLWADDFRRMREMSLEVIRIGEFAWSIFEPEEGRFEFGFFDRVMDLAHKHSLRVILGTPTATPPVWLTQKYPEALNANRQGVVYQHGMRAHCNHTAPIFRELSARIASRMAEHYYKHPALWGWQIDNELNCEVNVFYADSDHAAFRVWLQEKYETLNRLNAAWGAVFWNQTYSDWSQVYLSRPTPADSPNPHQALDEKRFISDSTISYAKLQADAIRAHDTTHFITTNGLFGHLDSHHLTDETLDFISYDAYPLFSEASLESSPEPMRDRRWGWNLSAVRGISRRFCIMEQQSGPGGWVNRLELPSPKPGQVRLWTYQSIAHGADMVLFFRWRTATMGTEIYWHGINDYHNQANRRCAEVARIGQELLRLADVAGSAYQADVAILRDYDNEWDGELDTWHGPYERQSASAWYAALQRRHVPVDSLTLRPGIRRREMSRYRVLIYPHPTILTDETARMLKEYANAGGRIIFGCRTGYKDIHGQCPMRPFPGAVADLCGVTVEDFTRIGKYQTEPSLDWDGVNAQFGELKSGPFNDILRLENPEASVIASYAADAGYYAGKPALTRNPWGDGVAYYYGGVFTEPVANALAEHLGLNSPLADRLTLPRDIEAAIRAQPDGETFVFLLNYADTPRTIQAHSEMVDLISGETVLGEVVMEPYGVLALR